MGTVSQSRRVFIALLCVGVVYALALTGAIRIPLGAPGTRDFVQYWGALELLRRGLNPYDGHLMREVQVALSPGSADVTMMWNPPWTPVVLMPVLMLPFERAAALWLFAQLSILILITIYTPRAVRRPNIPLLLSAIIVVSFLPALDALYWGQLSLLLTLGATMFVYFEGRGKLMSAGIALLPLTLKPHLLLCLLPAGALWWWRLSWVNRRRFLLGFIGGLLFLCVITLALAPNALSWWFAAVVSPSSSAGEVPTVQWKTATVTTWMRTLLADASRGAPVWPMLWLPLTALAGVCAYYWRYRPLVEWRITLPALVGISLLVGSYGWLYDQSILLIGIIAVVGDASSYRDRRDQFTLMTGVLGTELLALAQSSFGYNQQHYYVWIPVVVLCLLAFNRRCMRKPQAV